MKGGIMKKRTLVASILSVVAGLSAMLAIGLGNPIQAAADPTPIFDEDVTFKSEYGAGYALVIPSIEAKSGEERGHGH